MKYEEYQVWFHAYNTAIGSLMRWNSGSINTVIENADSVANHALEKYKNVEVPANKETKVPENISSEFRNIVEQVTKEAVKRGKR